VANCGKIWKIATYRQAYDKLTRQYLKELFEVSPDNQKAEEPLYLSAKQKRGKRDYGIQFVSR
jgi:hypothetical protein